MPFLNPPPGCQILWLEHQRCVLCGDKASHVALFLRIPKERMAHLKRHPEQMAEATISIASKPYCTICSPVVSYETDADGRDPVPDLPEPPERKPGWLARKLGVVK